MPTSRLPAPSGSAAPSRAGAPPIRRRPTRSRAGPSPSSFWMRSAPGKPPPRGGACRSPRPGRPRWGWSWCRCRGRRGRARLEPQRIAGAEADGLHLRIGQQRAGDRARPPRPATEISKPSLARVAGAENVAPGAVDLTTAPVHEPHPSATCRRWRAPAPPRPAALQRQQTASATMGSTSQPAEQGFAHMREIGPLAGGVDDQEEQAVSADAGDHQVVEDAAVIVRQNWV